MDVFLPEMRFRMSSGLTAKVYSLMQKGFLNFNTLSRKQSQIDSLLERVL